MPEFAADLHSNYAIFPHNDKNEWLYRKVRERTVEYCSKHSDHLSGAMRDVVRYRMRVEDSINGQFIELPDLEDFTLGFVAETIETYKDEMARRVAILIRNVWHSRAGDSADESKKSYLAVSPCNHLYHELRKSSETAAYAKFLRLAALPGYYPSTGWSH